MGVVGCTQTDGAVGATTLAVVNESDEDLDYTYEGGPIALPEVLATTIAAGQTTELLKQGGCFGCADPPDQVVTRFTVLRQDGAVVVDLDPVAPTDWTRVPDPDGGAYDLLATLTVTQAEVDAAGQ